MDMESRRRFVSSMMAATAAAMGGGMMFGGMPVFGQQTTVPDGGPPYLQTGGVQIGPDGVNGNPPPGPIGGPMDSGSSSRPARRRRTASAPDPLLRASPGSQGRESNGSPEKIPGTSRTTPSSRWTT